MGLQGGAPFRARVPLIYLVVRSIASLASLPVFVEVSLSTRNRRKVP
jgi:hypothetical protein